MLIPVPDDPTYDYVPITGPQLEVGSSVLALWTVQGEVSDAIPPTGPGGIWVYGLLSQSPDGSASFGFAVFPESQVETQWWGRLAIWKRTPKLADAETATLGDGSKWIYAAGEDGKMRCYASGTTWSRGDKRFLGHLLTDPADLWICDDTDWDWLPIADGSAVTVGDAITFVSASAGVVDQVVVEQTDTLTRTGFLDGSTVLGWWEDLHEPRVASWLNTWTWFERRPKPAADAKFRAADGSRWIYVGSSLYYCWGRGTRYQPGALFLRGEIAGLTPIS